MKTLIVNDSIIEVPENLEEVTLGQRIEFQERFGEKLDLELHELVERAKAPNANKRRIKQELDQDFIGYSFDKKFAVMSYFTGVPIKVLKDSDFTDYIIYFYDTYLKDIFE